MAENAIPFDASASVRLGAPSAEAKGQLPALQFWRSRNGITAEKQEAPDDSGGQMIHPDLEARILAITEEASRAAAMGQ